MPRDAAASNSAVVMAWVLSSSSSLPRPLLRRTEMGGGGLASLARNDDNDNEDALLSLYRHRWKQDELAIRTEFQALGDSSSSSSPLEMQKRFVYKGLQWEQEQQQEGQSTTTTTTTTATKIAASKPTKVTGCTANVVVQVVLHSVSPQEQQQQQQQIPEDTPNHGEANAHASPNATTTTSAALLDLEPCNNHPHKENFQVRSIHPTTTITRTTTTTTSSTLPAQPQRMGVVVMSVHGTCDALVSRGLLALWCQVCRHQLPDVVLGVDGAVLADAWGIRSALSPGRNDGLASLVRTTQSLLRELVLSSSSSSLSSEQEATSDQDPQLRQTSNNSYDSNNNRTLREDEPNHDEVDAAIQQHPSILPSPTTTWTIPPLPISIRRGRRKKRVALLLSGGVDSSVALHLLLRQGYDVTAFYLKIWLQDEVAHLGICPWQDDVQMCRQVCDHAAASVVVQQQQPPQAQEQAQEQGIIRVPLEILSLQQEYQDQVIAYTIAQARAGRTPNPDVLCNARIKFGCFYQALEQYMKNVEDNDKDDSDPKFFDYIATGHYAQLERNDVDNDDDDDGDSGSSVVRLLRAPDPVKDQSYFLCALTQQQLRRVLFPIGHLQKHQVRQLAEEFQLPNRHRPDSQGLCFLGKVKFHDFLESYLGKRPGPIVDAAGDGTTVLGRHDGIWFHTIGQRKGIGPYLFPQATAFGPWYVVAKDPSRDIVYCSNQYDDAFLERPRSQFTLERHTISWITGQAPPPASVTASRTRPTTEGGGGGAAASALRSHHPDSSNLAGRNDNTSNNKNNNNNKYNNTEGDGILEVLPTTGQQRLLVSTWRLDMKLRHGPKLIQGTLERWRTTRIHDESNGREGNDIIIHDPSVTTIPNNNNDDTWMVHLDFKDGGLAPGQYVVFYDPQTTECLGGGVISEQHWIEFNKTIMAINNDKNKNNHDKTDSNVVHKMTVAKATTRR
ncbi:hypothetical protein ACA910_021249 [Epithemia clementina (nom. ined.)]